jgi:26S proteasome regulatory subunit N1
MILALIEGDRDIKTNAYNMIHKEITNATTSMTSIPKPLKFARLHYSTLKKLHDETIDEAFKMMLADLLAVLATVSATEGETSLSYVLKGSKRNLETWGLEFMR